MCFRKDTTGSWHGGIAANSPRTVLASLTDIGSCPSCLTSDPAPSLPLGKTVEDDSNPQAPVLAGKNPRKLLALGFRSVQFWLLWLRNEDPSHFPSLFVKSAFKTKIKKSF